MGDIDIVDEVRLDDIGRDMGIDVALQLGDAVCCGCPTTFEFVNPKFPPWGPFCLKTKVQQIKFTSYTNKPTKTFNFISFN